MSSSYVRAKVRLWAAQVETATGVPFYDTINTHVSPTDDVWWTVEFFAETHEGNFCDRQYIENGYVDIVVAAQPGLGDAAALAAIEAVVPELNKKQDANNQLSLNDYTPPGEDTAGSADESYRLSVSMNYTFSKV